MPLSRRARSPTSCSQLHEPLPPKCNPPELLTIAVVGTGSMTVLYFVLAFAITWGRQLPALLARGGLVDGTPVRYMALVGLRGFGPMVAAMIVTGVERIGLKTLFRPLGIWRVGLSWYLAALLLTGGIFALTAAAWNALG